MKTFCLGSILLATLFSAPSCMGAENKMGKKMETASVEMPFHLKSEDLLKVEFNCEYHPLPKKPWTESIRISGVTGVTLIRQLPDASKPDTLHGALDPQAFLSLLKMFEDSGFFEKEVDVDPDGKDPVRYLVLAIPGESNRVAVGGRYQIPLEKLLGALRLAAGFGVPEALGKGFLERL